MELIACTEACTITLVVTPARATAEDYAAVSSIFGAALLALIAIWGFKKVIQLFQRPTDA